MSICFERARDGDPFATAAMVDALRPRVTKMAAYYARQCGEDRDDLLQEAWVGMLEALPEMDVRIGSPEQYLIQRAKWRLLDAVKRARIRRCAPLDEALMEDLSGSSMEAALASAMVSQFTRQLKPTQRTVLRHLMAGRTWREAGQEMGCTSANIAHHVRQIRRQYADWMDEAVPEEKHREFFATRKRTPVSTGTRKRYLPPYLYRLESLSCEAAAAGV